MKYFFHDDDEFCYQLCHWKDYGEDVRLELAKREYGVDHFWCTEFQGCFTEGCGKQCESYEPRNGKSGRCRFHQNTFIGTGKYYTYTKENKLIKEVK